MGFYVRDLNNYQYYFGVPYSIDRIIYPKTLFKLLALVLFVLFRMVLINRFLCGGRVLGC